MSNPDVSRQRGESTCARRWSVRLFIGQVVNQRTGDLVPDAWSREDDWSPCNFGLQSRSQELQAIFQDSNAEIERVSFMKDIDVVQLCTSEDVLNHC